MLIKRLLLAMLFALPLAACERDGAAEQAGENIDQSTEQFGQSMENAAENSEDALSDAGENMEEAGEEITD